LLELDRDVYLEFCNPLGGFFEDQTEVAEEFNNDLDALVQKKSSIDLNYE
jgi:hypothetical protein